MKQDALFVGLDVQKKRSRWQSPRDAAVVK